MKSHPKIVFCTTCKGRAQHIERTLPRNLADNVAPNSKFIVLDYGSQDHLIPYLKERHSLDIAKGRLSVYSYETAEPFRMSHAKNMAHRLGILEGADILVNMDADNFAGWNFDRYIEEKVRHEDLLWANAKSVLGRARQGLAGRIVVSSSAFLRTGGYDERYKFWAPEDEDFKARIRRLGCEGVAIEDGYLHVIPHKDGLRFKEYPHAKPTPETEHAALEEIRNGKHLIANWGQFGQGKVFRNFNPEDTTELGRVPTRIFGIGMHKTATTSLHAAFQILGLNSAHWTGPWWARYVWEEIYWTGRSPTVEKHYAMSDLPFTLLYRELDRAFPGSRFILTVRDEASWVESVRKHWEVNSRVFAWDHDCFTHKCHKMLYGRKSFDAETFLARYRRHNAEVLEYFKDRRESLLVMDMGEGAGWPELCGFLKYPIPNEPYPTAFKTGS